MAGVPEYNTDPDLNTLINSINIGEGCPASGINNAIRQALADTKAAVGHKGTTIASASSIDLGAATGYFVDISGTTTITALGTVAAGTRREVRFTGALTLTHNATSLILPGGANITTADGDTAAFISLGSGDWVCTKYSKASGSSVVPVATAHIADEAVTTAKIDDGAVTTAKLADDALSALRGHISGLIVSNNSTDAEHDVDIAVGAATADDQSVFIQLTSALTKRIDAAWAVGTNQGGLDTGTVAVDTGYYLWLIRRSDTGVVDVLFSASATSPTMPTNYDQKRLIGWVLTDSSANIRGFSADETAGGGLAYAWDDPPLDVDLSNTLTTSRRLDTLTVPMGLRVLAHINVHQADTSSAASTYICDPAANDEAPSTASAPLISVQSSINFAPGHALRVRTNTSGQIASRSSLATVDVYRIATLGFEWSRR